MNKALRFVRLDYITVKPYLTLKNLFIFSGVALVMMMSSGAGVSAIAITMVYAALYVSYPFAAGEQNGIDALYATLSIRRSTVVLGRYLFALVVDVCAGLLAYVFSFVSLTIMQKGFNPWESLEALLMMFALFSVIQAFQLPLYFKLGYAKAKFLAYVPFVGLALITLLFSNFLKERFSPPQISHFIGWISANPLIAALLAAVVWLGAMLISYQTSVSFYGKRDF